MKTRRLGGTGWEISVISFGAIKLPQLSQKECDILLNRAIDLGINLVDTADCYGDSEEKIGKALSRRREEFYLSTKVDERDGSGVSKKLERCLRRLKTDWIDLVLFHDVRGQNMSARDRSAQFALGPPPPLIKNAAPTGTRPEGLGAGNADA